MLKRQFCRTVAHYYVRAYGSEECVERGSFWGYFPFNDPCVWRTLEGLAAVSVQEQADGAGPGVLTCWAQCSHCPEGTGVSPRGRRGCPGWGEATAWAGSQGICSIPFVTLSLGGGELQSIPCSSWFLWELRAGQHLWWWHMPTVEQGNVLQAMWLFKSCTIIEVFTITL